MKLIKKFGNLEVTIVDDADGVNLYTHNEITNLGGLVARLNYSEPLTNLYVELNKIKKSADQLNENFKPL